MTPPKLFTQLFLEQPANSTGRHQHVNKQPGGKGCLQGITCWPFTKAGSRRQDTKKSLAPKHTPLNSKEIPQPHANNCFPETPCSTSCTGAGLALVLSAASSKGKGQLSMKGTQPESVQQVWQVCLSVCPGFGWDRVSVLLCSRYSAVVWI